jgi:hypothetical protein
MSLICFYTFSFEFIHVMTVTTGFENFFPKNGASKTATGGPKKPSSTGNNNNSNSNNKKSTKDDANSKTKTKKAAFSGSPFGKNTSSSNHNNSEPHPAVLLGLLAALVAGRSFLDSPQHNSKEISYKDFYALLEDGQIEKLVVVNREVARIVLKEGAHPVVSSLSSSTSDSNLLLHDRANNSED